MYIFMHIEAIRRAMASKQIQSHVGEVWVCVYVYMYNLYVYVHTCMHT